MCEEALETRQANTNYIHICFDVGSCTVCQSIIGRIGGAGVFHERLHPYVGDNDDAGDFRMIGI